jgi:MFS family permease
VIGWRWGLWMNIPLGILAILAAALFLHLPRHPKRQVRLDVFGMALLAIASAGIVLVSTWGGTKYDWGSVQIIGMIAGTVVAGVVFVLVELRVAEPVMPLHLFKKLNFNLMTGAGLAIGVAMFGTLAYIPTYLQMVTGANATQSGLLMIPMMGMVLLTSIVSGALVTKTGRYKWAPISGTLITALGMILLSTMTVGMPVWLICVFLATMGFGLGLCMQIFVLVVQNTFPNSMVGVATATNNYFRQIGASLGSAVVGTLFTTRLIHLITERMPAAAAHQTGSANDLTPDIVKHLPGPIHHVIISSYNDALAPIFLYILPLILAATVVVCFVREVPLKKTIDRGDAHVGGDLPDGPGLESPDAAQTSPTGAAGAGEEPGAPTATVGSHGGH